MSRRSIDVPPTGPAAAPVGLPPQQPVAPLLWLGDQRGHVADWATQRWVELTGRRFDPERYPWLDAPVGRTFGIGRNYFDELASVSGLEVRRGVPEAGLLSDFSDLLGPAFDPAQVAPAVVDFYEHTAAFEMDAWAEWSERFKPFGRLLAHIFSRRLQQLNVPLSGLDTSRGITSEIVQLVDPSSGRIEHTAWVRELIGTGNVLYAGSYSVAELPGCPRPCIRVAFPLPNGNAVVFMKPEVHEDGSFTVTSSGRIFGEPGFYFTIRMPDGSGVARYVRTLRESIRVYVDRDGRVHADHNLSLWGSPVLHLHYRLRRVTSGG